jgi:hypothetical protein
MCVAERSWGSKYKLFICSTLKPVSKSQQDEMRYTFDIAKCNRIFITCCRKNKSNCQVIMLYHHRNSSKSMLIVNGIILILLLVMIAIFSVNRFNRS